MLEKECYKKFKEENSSKPILSKYDNANFSAKSIGREKKENSS